MKHENKRDRVLVNNEVVRMVSLEKCQRDVHGE